MHKCFACGRLCVSAWLETETQCRSTLQKCATEGYKSGIGFQPMKCLLAQTIGRMPMPRSRMESAVIVGQGCGPSPAFHPFVESSGSTTVVSPSKDITFACRHCASPLVVDAAAAGMTLPCQRCGKPTLVPSIPATGSTRPVPDVAQASNKSPSASARPSGSVCQSGSDRVAELRRQLKENESQRTEVTGYINQLSIQLHRWQLRLQTLEERRQQLDSDLSDATK